MGWWRQGPATDRTVRSEAGGTPRRNRRRRAAREADEFATAAAHLESGDLGIRVAGIEALGCLMHGSRGHRRAVVEVLADFVRQRATRPPTAPGPDPRPEATGSARAGASSAAGVPSDVQAAMRVLNTRPSRISTCPMNLRGADLAGLELPANARNNTMAGGLSGADLTGADLTGARLDGVRLAGRLDGADLTGASLIGATFYQATLAGARLTGANLTRAWAAEADLTRARLDYANLTGANLGMAGLTYASLRGATLTGATLDETVLVGADLDSADLTKARLLTVGQLLSARLTETTRLDPRLADRPALIAHRVASRTRPAAGSNRSTTSRSS